ncbi:serine-threonine protein kinase, putative [Entamoeba invadens IP1]|uniref:serine-threonine protein kinase, putative n=1 Tax=Entamoeba invadens IP1 TaxID=370355 RepID=UPI0002C3DEDD|nr:serine-threonine protein kinase, putative [Entamoeba invadens IP1]ELP93269.1 serine-threonine protein kinase, putative [Entamoeba invadens IP1]|eukprot:XP_004260040.1 serine-threonine protein kinase, putative [Entamoeba invadens IP1]
MYFCSHNIVTILFALSLAVPVVRIFYNESSPPRTEEIWKKFAPSLTRKQFDLRYGGGNNYSQIINIVDEPNEVVVVAIDEITNTMGDEYIEAQKPLIRLLTENNSAPFTVEIMPSMDTIVATLSKLLVDNNYDNIVVVPDNKTKISSDVDAVIVKSDNSNNTLDLIKNGIKTGTPVFVILPINLLEPTYFVIQLLRRENTFIVVPVVTKDHMAQIKSDFVPYQAYLYDAMLVASHAVSVSLTNNTPLELFQGMVATQYNGMSGVFSFGIDGKRDKFLFSITLLENSETLKQFGLIDEGGYTITNPSLLPKKSNILVIAVSVSCAIFVFFIIFVGAALIVGLVVRSAVVGKIGISDVALTLPPLSATNHSKTYYGMWRLKKVCVKVLTTAHSAEEIKNTINFLRKLKNERIIRVYGGNTNPEMIVMEFAERESLHSIVLCFDAYIQVKEVQYKVIAQILEGLTYLHQKKILHLNLTPSNVLITTNYDAKLSDMEVSVFAHQRIELIDWKKIKIRYSPPEILDNSELDERTDVYMWAMVIWFIATSIHPFQEISDKKRLIDTIKSGEKPISSLINDSDLIECVEMCWKPKEKRPSVAALKGIANFTHFTHVH